MTITRFIVSVDRNKMFEAVTAVGDGGQTVGSRLVGVLLSGDSSFREDVGLAFYGVEVTTIGEWLRENPEAEER